MYIGFTFPVTDRQTYGTIYTVANGHTDRVTGQAVAKVANGHRFLQLLTDVTTESN